MPLLGDISTAQASLKNHLAALQAHPVSHCRVFSSSFIFGDDKRLSPPWKSFQFPAKLLTHGRGELIIKAAIATLEPKHLVRKQDAPKSCEIAQHSVDSDNLLVGVKSLSEELEGLDERESLRRRRISKANKGNTPWNKGRKHSPETIQLIRERTKLAMKNPKVKMKLAKLGHAQSKETKMKIGAGVRMRWAKRREKQMVQESCYMEWQNLIAEYSRRGYAGEEELQWDSYSFLKEKLELEWVETMEQRKRMLRPKGSKRAPKPLEQRRKIAEAIAAKWADPGYRKRVCSAMSKYHGAPVGTPRKSRRKPSSGPESAKLESAKKKKSNINDSSADNTSSLIQFKRLRRSKSPVYKDPMASSKLEMIKNIRAQRAAEETKKAEAIERARLLIAEAEKAAKALEVAATRSHVAQASLFETRKLIAEAVQLIESIGVEPIIPNKNDGNNTLAPNGLENHVGMDLEADYESWNHAEPRNISGIQFLRSTSEKDEDLNFTKFSFHHMLNGSKQLELPKPNSNGYVLPPCGLETLVEKKNSSKQFGRLEPSGLLSDKKLLVNGTNQLLVNGSNLSHREDEPRSKSGMITKKKWVRGRFVEVTEGG